MKQIIIALTLVGCMNISADAQSKSKFDKNYKVCKSDAGYAVCGKEGTVRYMQSDNTAAWNNNAMPEIILLPIETADNTSLEMNNVNSYEGYYRRHNIIVGDDDMNAPYRGLPSQQYDGPDKNEQRNLNYNQTGMQLPPSNGSNVK